MGMRYGFKIIILCICVLCAAMAVWSCSGGSSGDAPAPQSFPGFTPAAANVMMTADDANSQKAAALIMFSHAVGGVEGADGYLPAVTTEVPTGYPVINTVLELFRSELNDTAPYQANHTTYGSDSCPGGSGTMTVTMSWTGPEQLPSSDLAVVCDQLNDVTMDISMSNCAIDNTSRMSGLISFQTTGQLCTPATMEITMNNLSIYVGADTIQTRQLNMVLSNLTWDRSIFSGGTITSGQTVLNGQAVGVMDGQPYAGAFDNYTESMEMLGGSLIELSMSGMVTGPCLDGWVDIETVTPIRYYEYNDCPHAGELSLHCADDAQIPIVFEADGGLSIDDSIYFDSCDAIDGDCPW